MQKIIDDLKKENNCYSTQIENLKNKNKQFEQMIVIMKQFIKIFKPSDDVEKEMYFNLKNSIEL